MPMALLSVLSIVGCSAPGSTGPTTQNAAPPGSNQTNSPPSISGAPSDEVIAGDTYSFTPTAIDPNGDRLTFNISRRPPWARFDDATGSISGTPDDNDVGMYDGVAISVSDGMSTDSLPAFTIEVAEANAGPIDNSAPVISGSPRRRINANNQYNFRPTADDADGDTLTFSVSKKPGWARFDTATGRLSGTPDDNDVGTYDDIAISVSDGTASDSLPEFTIEVAAASAAPIGNSAPVISGNPRRQVNANDQYNFTPTANDANGDTLTFSVSGLPVWANFNNATGRISGTPKDADVGTYNGIAISVSDGAASDSLAPFTITVNAVSLGSATLRWTPPTENEDGSALTDLAGYRIYWGTTPGSYPNSVTIDNAGISSYVVDNLAPGTYEFVATSFNTAGDESVYSNVAVKTVSSN